MIRSMRQLLSDGSSDAILEAMASALQRSDESPFWAEKVLPLARAVLSVLIPLREQQLLFDPEGVLHGYLTPELLLRWCDLMCLKHLAFTLQASNAHGRLERSKYPEEKTDAYTAVDLNELGAYLSGYGVDLQNEYADFPITHYNLHTGLSDVIGKLLR